jgi:hypothetical protein
MSHQDKSLVYGAMNLELPTGYDLDHRGKRFQKCTRARTECRGPSPVAFSIRRESSVLARAQTLLPEVRTVCGMSYEYAERERVKAATRALKRRMTARRRGGPPSPD